MKEISKEGWGRCSEQSSSARWHWRGQLREAAVTTHLKTREGGCSMQRNRRCKRRGALWHHRALLPLAAGLGLDDHFLRPYLPHLCAAVGTERLPGAWYVQFLSKARQSQAKQDKVSALTSSPYHLWLACCVFTISFLNWSACYSPIFLLQVSNAPLHPPLCNCSIALSKILV